ncbi:MAG TPA: hypothetical protein VFQ59_00510 [Candidatus Paceibacterota bacterium]|nr:hypothetical protein [Candidatus Paceibacterota bacterium]
MSAFVVGGGGEYVWTVVTGFGNHDSVHAEITFSMTKRKTMIAPIINVLMISLLFELFFIMVVDPAGGEQGEGFEEWIFAFCFAAA